MRFEGALVLRPEPGNARTAARLAAIGIPVRACPLFAVSPVPWSAPDATRHDALLLTSANAVRHAGSGLHALAHLPTLAVGPATAHAATEAGLHVALTGEADAATLLAQARAHGFSRPLHLGGRDRVAAETDAVTVYRSDPLAIDAAAVQGWTGHVALLHSPRAARRFAALADDHLGRTGIAVAALSEAIADAAGSGWAARVVAEANNDARLVTHVASLIDRAGHAADKCAR